MWDVIHTFIRVPAGAILAATAFADFSPEVRLMALLIGGGIALSSHGAKTATRLAANTSPEPVSNVLLSWGEMPLTVGGSAWLVSHPVLLAAIVGVAVIGSLLLCRWIYRALRRIFVGRQTPSTHIPSAFLNFTTQNAQVKRIASLTLTFVRIFGSALVTTLSRTTIRVSCCKRLMSLRKGETAMGSCNTLDPFRLVAPNDKKMGPVRFNAEKIESCDCSPDVI